MNHNYKTTITIPKNRPFKNVYQFKITLLGTDPPVWRRILIPESYTFYDLHVAIQDAMGWQDYHLHCFVFKIKLPIGGHRIIRIECPFSEPDLFGDEEELYTTEVPLKRFFVNVKDKTLYEYDYGDGWEHEIVLEDILPKREKVKYPVCLAGELACPPEDCGGVPGYYDCIEAIKNQDNSDDRLDWLGDWAPDNFNPDEVKFEEPRKRYLYATRD